MAFHSPSLPFRALVLIFSLIVSASTSQMLGDAPFTQDEGSYQDSIFCPRGIRNKPGGVIFLVHGTGSTGEESWGQTAYNERLAAVGKGYDICWVTIPNRSLGDAQLSAEYVAYGIGYLSQRSPGASNRINVIAHSQGAGLNVQWALTFWPSLRPSVINFISLAGDFKGTSLFNPLCGLSRLIGGCAASVLQQSPHSKLLAAQNSDQDLDSGASALVPTTSIYTIYDEIVEFEGVSGFTSSINGANMIEVQSPSVCGPTHVIGHLLILIDEAVFNLATDAVVNGRPTDINNFDRTTCDKQVEQLVDNVDFLPNGVTALLSSVLGEDRVTMIYNEVTRLRVPREPKLQPYVCERGYAKASDCQSSSGFQNNSS